MNPQNPTRSRYELRDVLGRGGMGVIYKAYDTLMRREVALKTILDVQNKSALDLFYREWGLQASITHPNVAEIYDIGQIELEGGTRPYFVMPLLPGMTLADMLRDAPHRLTVERVVDMVGQTCRGLQAAHEKGLIHRDLKPSNIFVLADDSVKIIDFGIAQVDTSAMTSVRGTLAYMAPELLQMKSASVASDVFALGVVTYEALTRRRPFEGANDNELSRSILYHNPPPVSELNPASSQAVARAVQKAIAKQPWSRYNSVKEYGEILNKAMRGEPIDYFDPEKVRPRIERAARAFERGEYPVANEMLTELESEGHIEQEIVTLRRQVEAAQRQVAIRTYLESARRFFEEEEYQLALRKVQEAQDLDPNNTDTQALKNEIEKKRRERKIEEWAQLAQKHLANNAFAHARSALGSLLELRPNDTQATALMQEIKRREDDFERIRQEKSRFYSVARQAYERGEVTAALQHLEKFVTLDKSSPETDAERLMSFQNFYNQVRGEHEAIKSSYEKARKLLSEGQFADSFAICQQYLSKYPGHALFQALKYDVDERQRQAISAFIAETDRRVESEPDLDRRVSVLEEALKQHPDEGHFERALKLTKDKRDLVSSVVSKARLHEDQGRFSEALDQWEVLRAIHGSYPGLDYEIERVQKRRDTQSRTDAKTQWVTQIDRQLEARSFTHATATCDQALAEFPDDPELLQMRSLAEQRESRQKEALEFLAQAKQASSEGAGDAALELVRKAFSIDESCPEVKLALCETLTEQARTHLETNSDQADALIREVLAVDPQYGPALNQRALGADRKKDEFISWCTAQARKLQAANDLEGAIAVVQQALASYPNEARLNQLLTMLDKNRAEANRKQSRKRDLETIVRLEAEAKATKDRVKATGLLDEAQKLAGEYPDDKEFQTCLGSLKQAVAALTAEMLTSATLAPPKAVALPPQSLPTVVQTPIAATPKTPPPPAPPAAPPPPPPPPAPPASAKVKPAVAGEKSLTPAAALAKNKRFQLGFVAAALVLLGAGLVAVLRRPSTPPPPPTFKVDIRTTPPGAAVRIGGVERGVSNLTLDLQSGEYKAEAELDGYQPAVTTFTVKEGAPVSVDIPLQPWKPYVRVVSDVIEQVQATLGDKPLNAGQQGEYQLDGIAAASYTLRLASPQGEVSVGLMFDDKMAPTLTTPPQAKTLRLLLLCLQGDRAIIYTTSQGAKAGLDAQPTQPVPPEGLSLKNLPRGAHALVFEEGATPRTVNFNSNGQPGALAFVMTKADPETGVVVVTANEDNAVVSINGYAHPLKTRGGSTRLSGYKPGKYQIRVAKEGFEVTPPQQEVEILKGQEAKVQFTLKAVVKLARLKLASAPAGAQVVVDGAVVGAVGADGAFESTIPPGSHTVELRRGSAKSKAVQRNFSPGETAQMGAELALAQPGGTVKIDVTPGDARVTYRVSTEAESQAKPVTQNPLPLPEGNYIIAASAANYSSAQYNVSVIPGGASAVNITLRPLESKKAAAPAPAAITGMSDFEDPAQWSNDGPWMVRKGGGYIRFNHTPSAGTFTFTIAVPRGRNWLTGRGKSLQWFTGMVDTRNFVLYKLDSKTIQRVDKVNGRDTEAAKKAHNIDQGGTFEVSIEVDQHRVATSLQVAGRWEPMDEISDPNRDFSAGKFGFYIPGNDEYAVRNFKFVPKR